MAYKDSYVSDLNDIISLLHEKKKSSENIALAKFDDYLVSMNELGSFDLAVWKTEWRKKIWKFGEEFRDINPNQFISTIDERIKDTSYLNKEVLEFIKSEIIVNFLPDSECKKKLEELIETYPLNPEFRNTLGQYYSRERNYLKAVDEFKIAMKLDPSNLSFINNRLKRDQMYLHALISSGEYQEGKNYIEQISKEVKYLESGNNVKAIFRDLTRRFDDHIHFQGRLEMLESDFKGRLQQELEHERKKIIEVIGFFSAIVAFILTTVSIGENFKFLEACFFLIILGIVLILFAVTLSVLHSNSKVQLFEDKKFWVLIMSLIFILVLVLSLSSIAKILSTF